MKTESFPTSWDQYSSTSSEEIEDENINQVITEASKEIFLRKYASFPLSKEELIDVFIQSNYDDNVIKQKLDERLAYNQEQKKNKRFGFSSNNNKEKNNMKSKYQSTNYKRNHMYTNTSNTSKAHNKYFKRKKPFELEKNNSQIDEVNSEENIEDNRSVDECNEYVKKLNIKQGDLVMENKISSQDTSTGKDMLSQMSNTTNKQNINKDGELSSELKSENKSNENINVPIKDIMSNYPTNTKSFVEPAYSLQTGNYYSNGMYASVMFPGVFYNKPISLNKNCIQKEKATKKNSLLQFPKKIENKEDSNDKYMDKNKHINVGLSRAFDYYCKSLDVSSQ